MFQATDKFCLPTRTFLTLKNLSTTRMTVYMQAVLKKLKRRKMLAASGFHGSVGVSTMEAAQIHFCKKGVKTKAKVYQDAILVPIM